MGFILNRIHALGSAVPACSLFLKHGCTAQFFPCHSSFISCCLLCLGEADLDLLHHQLPCPRASRWVRPTGVTSWDQRTSRGTDVCFPRALCTQGSGSDAFHGIPSSMPPLLPRFVILFLAEGTSFLDTNSHLPDLPITGKMQEQKKPC